MRTLNRKISLLAASLLTMPFLSGATSTPLFAKLSGDNVGILSKEKDKTFKVSICPVSSGSYYFSILLTNSLISNYVLYSTRSGYAMQASRYTSFSFTIPSKYVSDQYNVFTYRIDGITGNYTGKSLRYSVSINAGESHLMNYQSSDKIYTYGPYYICYQSGKPKAAYVRYWLEATDELYDDSKSNKVGKANSYFQYQNEAGANILPSTYQAELRVYDYIDDFELGEIASEKGVSFRKFPLVIEASGIYENFATYNFHLAPHLVSRKNLVMSKGEEATSTKFVSTDFFLPSGYGHVGETYRFEIIIKEISENLDEIRMNFNFYHSHEQFGSFYDGDYVVRIGGANG